MGVWVLLWQVLVGRLRVVMRWGVCGLVTSCSTSWLGSAVCCFVPSVSAPLLKLHHTMLQVLPSSARRPAQVKEVPAAAAAWADEFDTQQRQQGPSMWGEEFAAFQAQQHPAATGEQWAADFEGARTLCTLAGGLGVWSCGWG